MRVLIISDIHGYSESIKLLESRINIDSFNNIVILGDVFSDYHTTLDDRKVIIVFINRYHNKLIVVRGNCDTEDYGGTERRSPENTAAVFCLYYPDYSNTFYPLSLVLDMLIL